MICHYKPFPVISTERLVLRQTESSDAFDVFKMRNHPDMHLYTDSIPDETIDQTYQYLKRIETGIEANKFIFWAIELKKTRRVIGTISLWNFNYELNSAEFGYGLHPDFHHCGYMSEAIKTILNYGFNEMKLSMIEAYTETDNFPSVKLLNRLGFVNHGSVIDHGQVKERDFIMQIYQIKPKNA